VFGDRVIATAIFDRVTSAITFEHPRQFVSAKGEAQGATDPW
jgi:hypothetical protein